MPTKKLLMFCLIFTGNPVAPKFDVNETLGVPEACSSGVTALVKSTSSWILVAAWNSSKPNGAKCRRTATQ